MFVFSLGVNFLISKSIRVKYREIKGFFMFVYFVNLFYKPIYIYRKFFLVVLSCRVYRHFACI